MLIIFSGVLDDEIGQCMLSYRSEPANRAVFGRLFHALALEAELSSEQSVGNAWQNHLLNRVLNDENAFSLKAQRAPLEAMGAGLLEAARQDLERLRGLYDQELCQELGRPAFKPLGEREPWPIKTRLAQARDWRAQAEALAAHFREHGAGELARHRTFRWDAPTGQIEPILDPDPIRLEDLFTYDAERALLLANTEQFLAGQPANNVLLYGERGTGKSSTIKALLQRYVSLKMIEVAPADLADLPKLLPRLASNPGRFVLFVDDLSFDEMELQYKHLKAVLEGGLQARPANVVIYATSNRRHLVKERFSDMTKAIINDEIHHQDTVQEKLSLSDRFGITLTFVTPDQARYLNIVEGLATARLLGLSPDELKARAIRWAMYHNGLSGRTARQFVDFVKGELRLAESRTAVTPR